MKRVTTYFSERVSIKISKEVHRQLRIEAAMLPGHVDIQDAADMGLREWCASQIASRRAQENGKKGTKKL